MGRALFSNADNAIFYATAENKKQHLIVAGGRSQSTRLNTVEIMNIETLVWSTAASLLHSYSRTSATNCGDVFYLLGGAYKKSSHKSIADLFIDRAPTVTQSISMEQYC